MAFVSLAPPCNDGLGLNFYQIKNGLSPETNSFAGSTGITLRPATQEDRAFLLEVYASTREEELARKGWNETQLAVFVEERFVAQQADFETQFPDSVRKIVLVDGERVGSLWVNRCCDEIRLLDLALLTAHRNQGIGTFLLGRLLAEAANSNKPVRYTSPKINNGTERLYKRLGFRVIRDLEDFVEMEWTDAGGESRTT